MSKKKETSLESLVEDVIEAWSELNEKGIREGTSIGIEKGKKQGRKKHRKQALARMIEKGTYTSEEMAEILGLPVEKVLECVKKFRADKEKEKEKGGK